MEESTKIITTPSTSQIKITDDLDALLNVLPVRLKETLTAVNEGEKLIEIVMDLGRLPEARFTDHEMILSEREITEQDLDYVTDRIGEFMGDNRAGIERTLHRIFGIRTANSMTRLSHCCDLLWPQTIIV